MLAKLFAFGKRNYINNAVVTADVLDFIIRTFGDVTNFRLQFKKPFLTQGEFRIGIDKLDGHFIGHFDFNNTRFYFAYSPTDIELENKNVSVDDVKTDVNMFSVCYYISDTGHRAVLEECDRIYGPRTNDDKAIFVIYEIPDTSVISAAVKSKIVPKVDITKIEHIGDRRFKLSVFVNDKFFGYRYNTVKKFI